MARKSKNQQLTDSMWGRHLALSVAAHLARTQLVADPRSVYDSRHLLDMLDVMARALAKVAPLYAQDPATGQARELTLAELEGASISRGATRVTLRDGRTLSGVTIQRSELRQAIAVLRAVGLQEFLPQAAQAAPAAPPAPDRTQESRAQLAELEALLRPPLVPSQIDQASRLAVSLARSAPHGHVANLAMQLMSALHEARGGNGSGEIPLLIAARLRAALEGTASTPAAPAAPLPDRTPARPPSR